MGFPEIAGIVVLVFALGAQLRLRSFLLENRTKIVAASIVLVALALSFLSWVQYQVWRHDPMSQYLLPPHQSTAYFWTYVATRFFGAWLISGVCGYAAYWSARLLNKKFDRRFFEDEEPFLFGLAVFGAGYPVFLFYIILMAAAGLLLTVVYTLFKKGRAPLYYLWLPLALCAILIEES